GRYGATAASPHLGEAWNPIVDRRPTGWDWSCGCQIDGNLLDTGNCPYESGNSVYCPSCQVRVSGGTNLDPHRQCIQSIGLGTTMGQQPDLNASAVSKIHLPDL